MNVRRKVLNPIIPRWLLVWSCLGWLAGLPLNIQGAMRAPDASPYDLTTSPNLSPMESQPSPSSTNEQSPRTNLFSNLSLGLGIGSILADVGIIFLALACFGGCNPLILIIPLIVTLGMAVTAVVFGIRALQQNPDPKVQSIQVKSIIGLFTAVIGGGFTIYALINSAINGL